MPVPLSRASRGSSQCSPTSSDGPYPYDVLTPISMTSDPSLDDQDYGESLSYDGRTSVHTVELSKQTGPGDVGPMKRPRGRPRIHPPKPKKELVRTRTGCFTCRRRKKKCDESGFPCGNCTRTAGVECEGYPDQDLHSPRSSSARSPTVKTPLKVEQLVMTTPSPQESPMNTRNQIGLLGVGFARSSMSPPAWLNYKHVARLFSVEQGSDKNPLHEKLVPLALGDPGLSHCLLYLSTCNMLADQTQENNQIFGPHHESLRKIAMETIMNNVELANHHCSGDDAISDVTRALPMALCLASTLTGDVTGAYALHLKAVRHMAVCRPSPDPSFAHFVDVFSTYVSTCHAVTSLHWQAQASTQDPLHLNMQPTQPSYLCLPQHLLFQFQRVTQLRHQVRKRRNCDLQPTVEPHVHVEAGAIESEMLALPYTAEGSGGANSDHEARELAVLLVRRCLGIYLHRTVSASEPSPVLHDEVDRALQSAEQLVDMPSTHAILLMPLFILGCACWPMHQRTRFTQLFQKFYRNRQLPNIKNASRVITYVWRYMDHDHNLSWDWEAIMANLQVDFLLL